MNNPNIDFGIYPPSEKSWSEKNYNWVVSLGFSPREAEKVCRKIDNRSAGFWIFWAGENEDHPMMLRTIETLHDGTKPNRPRKRKS